ncbi:hypothetical protein XELAEV_180099731mg, partial [Xenopus laevis]
PRYYSKGNTGVKSCPKKKPNAAQLNHILIQWSTVAELFSRQSQIDHHLKKAPNMRRMSRDGGVPRDVRVCVTSSTACYQLGTSSYREATPAAWD